MLKKNRDERNQRKYTNNYLQNMTNRQTKGYKTTHKKLKTHQHEPPSVSPFGSFVHELNIKIIKMSGLFDLIWVISNNKSYVCCSLFNVEMPKTFKKMNLLLL